MVSDVPNLSEIYKTPVSIKEKVAGKTSLEDCRHIALATIYKVDVLASWNFKHIVNLSELKAIILQTLGLVTKCLKSEVLKTLLIMKTTKKEKTFDAVKMMRDIRDKVSSET